MKWLIGRFRNYSSKLSLRASNFVHCCSLFAPSPFELFKTPFPSPPSLSFSISLFPFPSSTLKHLKRSENVVFSHFVFLLCSFHASLVVPFFHLHYTRAIFNFMYILLNILFQNKITVFSCCRSLLEASLNHRAFATCVSMLSPSWAALLMFSFSSCLACLLCPP